MIPDYHIHTSLCGHARGTLDELAEAAVSRGMREIGISDHMPLLYMEDAELAMSADRLPVYVESVLDLKERFRGRLEVRLGIEADYHPGTMEERASMIEQYPFDYVIGSVHAIGDWIFDDPRKRHRYEGIDLDAFYTEYFKLNIEMAETGVFDIAGHVDLAKKFGYRPRMDMTDLYGELIERLKKSGMCYEINTAGLRWPADEVYPDPSFVRLGHRAGVPITFGSDAHCPEDIGRDFEIALRLARSAGYTEGVRFDGRAMTAYELPESHPP